jgi:predicted DNA-binding transcriptional regulator AlpA
VRKRLRYADLRALGVVTNRVTLNNWIRDLGFPRGQLTGPNSRTWGEDEVQAWIAKRPTAPKPTPQLQRRPGRPRKAEREHNASA